MEQPWKNDDKNLRDKYPAWERFRSRRYEVPAGFHSPLKLWIECLTTLELHRTKRLPPHPGQEAMDVAGMVTALECMRTGWKSFAVSEAILEASDATDWGTWDLVTAPLPLQAITFLMPIGNWLCGDHDATSITVCVVRATSEDGNSYNVAENARPGTGPQRLILIIRAERGWSRFVTISKIEDNKVILSDADSTNTDTITGRVVGTIHGLLRIMSAHKELVEHPTEANKDHEERTDRGNQRETAIRPGSLGRTYSMKGAKTFKGSHEWKDEVRRVRGHTRNQWSGSGDKRGMREIWIQPYYAAPRKPEMQAAKAALVAANPLSSPNRTRDWNRDETP